VTKKMSFGKLIIITIFFLLFFTGVSSAIISPPMLITTNLTSYYKLDENNGTIAVDSSGNNNNATITNGVWTVGRYGYGVDLTNNGKIVTDRKIPLSQLTSGKGLLITMWVRLDSKPDKDGYYYYDENILNAINQTTGKGFKIFYRYGDTGATKYTQIAFKVTYEGDATVTRFKLVNDLVTSKDRWIRITFYIDPYRTEIGLYSPENRGYYIYTETNKLGLNDTYLDFGGFKGAIDDIRIYEFVSPPSQTALDNEYEAMRIETRDLNNMSAIKPDQVSLTYAKELGGDVYAKIDDVTKAAVIFWVDMPSANVYTATIAKNNYYSTNVIIDATKGAGYRFQRIVAITPASNNAILEKFTLALLGREYDMSSVELQIYATEDVLAYSNYFDVQGNAQVYLDSEFVYKIVIKSPDGNYYYGQYRADPSGTTTVTIPPGDTQDYQYVTFKVYKGWKPYNTTIEIRVGGITLYDLQTGDDGVAAAYLKKTQRAEILVNTSEKRILTYPISDVYVIMIPSSEFNASVNTSAQEYNMSVANNTFNLLNVTKNFNAQASPAAKGIVSSFVLLTVMGGIAYRGFEASPIGIFVLIMLAIIGVTDWITAFISILAVVGLFIIRRGVSG